MNLPAPLWKRLRRTLTDLSNYGDFGEPDIESMARDALDLLQRLEPRKAPVKPLPFKPSRVVRKEKKADRKLSRARVRLAVASRACGNCENCGTRVGGAGIWDHWLGGVGRRAQSESVETTWLLCFFCNDGRTLNKPSAAHWNKRFQAHCDAYGYPFKPHKERT